MSLRTALIIPALDEEQALPLVLGALPGGLVNQVVVVDNGSRDRTAAVARGCGAQVVTAARRGYGSACLAGLAHLAGDPPDIVAFLDADFSDDPADLAAVLGLIQAGHADLVVGSRVLGRCQPGAIPWHVHWGNRLATTLIKALHGGSFTDLGPFRAISWAALQRLSLRDPGCGWNVEMQVKALRRGLRCAEVPVAYRRRVGVSKISGTLAGSIRAGTAILISVVRYGRGDGSLRHSGTH
jgi:glycosyltransferase involved in cell wall biosynthesis